MTSTPLRRLVALCVATLGLLAGSAQAVEIRGSTRITLDPWGSRPGEIDLAQLAGLGSDLRFTQVRATFSAQVLSTTWDQSLVGDYQEIEHRREDWGQPSCHWMAVVWCINESWTYQRELVKTLTQDDRTVLAVQLGSASGQDGLKGTLTRQWREDMGIQSDASDHILEQIPYVADWFNEMGQPQPTRFAYWHQWRHYQTHSVVDYVLSSKTELSVTLELDAASLAELSATGLLRYDMQSFGQTYRPELLLDYVALSAVPEPATWLLNAGGLALMMGWRRRRSILLRSAQHPQR